MDSKNSNQEISSLSVNDKRVLTEGQYAVNCVEEIGDHVDLFYRARKYYEYYFYIVSDECNVVQRSEHKCGEPKIEQDFRAFTSQDFGHHSSKTVSLKDMGFT